MAQQAGQEHTTQQYQQLDGLAANTATGLLEGLTAAPRGGISAAGAQKQLPFPGLPPRPLSRLAAPQQPAAASASSAAHAAAAAQPYRPVLPKYRAGAAAAAAASARVAPRIGILSGLPEGPGYGRGVINRMTGRVPVLGALAAGAPSVPMAGASAYGNLPTARSRSAVSAGGSNSDMDGGGDTAGTANGPGDRGAQPGSDAPAHGMVGRWLDSDGGSAMLDDDANMEGAAAGAEEASDAEEAFLDPGVSQEAWAQAKALGKEGNTVWLPAIRMKCIDLFEEFERGTQGVMKSVPGKNSYEKTTHALNEWAAASYPDIIPPDHYSESSVKTFLKNLKATVKKKIDQLAGTQSGAKTVDFGDKKFMAVS